jgi:hypothetical protein
MALRSRIVEDSIAVEDVEESVVVGSVVDPDHDQPIEGRRRVVHIHLSM